MAVRCRLTCALPLKAAQSRSQNNPHKKEPTRTLDGTGNFWLVLVSNCGVELYPDSGMAPRQSPRLAAQAAAAAQALQPAAMAPTLLVLPDELLRLVLMKTPPISTCRAASTCQCLRTAAESACQIRLATKGSWKYVPLETGFRSGRLTWREQCALGFNEGVEAVEAGKLLLLRAGLMIYGSPCFLNSTAVREAQVMAEVLNFGQAGESESEGEDDDGGDDGGDDNPTTYVVEDRGLFGMAVIYSVERKTGRRSEAIRVRQLATDEDREPALVARIDRWALSDMGLTKARDLTEGIISDEIILSPWYIAADIWIAIAVGDRPAIVAGSPLIAIKTESRFIGHEGEVPQTTVELRDGTHSRVLGRAKLRYSTRPIDNTSGPTLWTFLIFPAAAADGSLVPAALLADGSRPETQRVLAEAAARSERQANLLAARILLWCGVVASCESHLHPGYGYHLPLRASPDLSGKHGPFLAWRGMTVSGRSWGGFPRIRLGQDDFFYFCASPSDSSSDDEVLDSKDTEGDHRFAAKLQKKQEARDAARARAGKSMLSKSFQPDAEDADSSDSDAYESEGEEEEEGE